MQSVSKDGGGPWSAVRVNGSDSTGTLGHRSERLLAKAQFALTDVRGRGVEAAVLYLEKVGAFNAKRDAAWKTICDLRDLRHLIVHRAGTKGQSEEHRKTARRLANGYPKRIVFPNSDWSWYGEVWISIPLCQEFITTIEEFFDRVFAALDLPPRFKPPPAEDVG